MKVSTTGEKGPTQTQHVVEGAVANPSRGVRVRSPRRRRRVGDGARKGPFVLAGGLGARGTRGPAGLFEKTSSGVGWGGITGLPSHDYRGTDTGRKRGRGPFSALGEPLV